MDLRGIFVAPKGIYYGYLNKIEEVDKGFDPGDTVVYELRRYFGLAAQCNPNIIEMLWTDSKDWEVLTPLAVSLVDIRSQFLSKQARHSFSGYAVAQLRRIQGHNKWLNLIKAGREPKMPTRAEFGLPELPTIPHDQREAAESLVKKRIESWNIDMANFEEPAKIAFKDALRTTLAEMKLGTDEEIWRAAGRSIGLDTNMMVVIEGERKYNSKAREFKQFQEWKQNRNESRSELEAKHGFDTKHGMHLVRLMRMCREILSEGVVKVKRPDAQELLAIRNGDWSYDKLIAWAEEEDKALERLYKESKLPNEPNRVKLDAHCVRMVESAIEDNTPLLKPYLGPLKDSMIRNWT